MDELTKQLLQNASINAASSSGYGGGGFLRGLGDVLSFLSGGVNAPSPGAGIIQGLGNVVNRFGTRGYLDSQSKAAAYNALMERNDNVSQAQAAYGGIPGYQGYGKLPDAQTGGAIQQSLQNPNINAMLQGKPLRQAQHGAYDSTLTNKYMDRLGNVVDENQTVGELPGAYGFGFNRGGFIPQEALGMMGGMGSGTTQVSPLEALNTPGQPQFEQDPMLMAGASETAYPTNPIFNTNPFGIPAVKSAEINKAITEGTTGRRDVETNTRGNLTIEETGRHNKASEAIDKQNADANTLRAQKYQPGGGASNPYTAQNTYEGIITRRLDAIDQELKGKFGAKDGKIKIPTDASKPGYIQAQRLLQEKSALMQNLGSGVSIGSQQPGSAPFKGKSLQGLNEAQTNLLQKLGF